MAQYIEVHSELTRHPKTKRLRRLLGIPVIYAKAHLVEIWTWAMDYAPNGDLTKYDVFDIAEAAEWEGDPEAFLAALLDCGINGGAGFLERTESGLLIIHDWHRYGGRLLISRFTDYFRKRNHRQPTIEEIHSLFPAEMVADLGEFRPENTIPSEFHRSSSGIPAESVGVPVEFQRSIEQRSVAERSIEQRSVEQQQQHRANSDGKSDSGLSSEAAAAAIGEKEKERTELPFSGLNPLPGEKLAVYARRIIPKIPGHWLGELDRRWKSAYQLGKGYSEFAWKGRILADWTSGAEPPPEPPTSARNTVRAAVSIPPDWFPGLSENIARPLCRSALEALKAEFPDITPTDERVRDRAREMYQRLQEAPARTPRAAGPSKDPAAVGSILGKLNLPGKSGSGHATQNKPKTTEEGD